MEQIQDRLKQLRKRLDLKQRDVAERLEMNVGTVGAWECGSEKIPKTRIYQICKEYNVRKEWLIDGEGEMFVKEEMSPAMLKKQILLIYNSLPEDYQRAFCEVAKAISDAKSL
ncbi:MAG: helix-turn-helix transcriptional regulator, partial [Thermoguttaceae bacterium]|nr:helix-turn-helix transcriptional regulator [Thermoguttaceae bacterium]